MNKQVILSSAYLAPVQYYTKFLLYDRIFIEGYEHYVKQSYRNRTVIATAAGRLSLTVPVEKEEGGKTQMKDVRLSDHGNWRHVHWNAFEAGYRQSPFFDYYADGLRRIFDRPYRYLFDFNMELCRWACEQIDITPRLHATSAYESADAATDDLREAIHPKVKGSNPDACFAPLPYYQVFEQKNGFLPNLSIVDLLFNMGPESILVLRRSITAPPNID